MAPSPVNKYEIDKEIIEKLVDYCKNDTMIGLTGMQGKSGTGRTTSQRFRFWQPYRQYLKKVFAWFDEDTRYVVYNIQHDHFMNSPSGNKHFTADQVIDVMHEEFVDHLHVYRVIDGEIAWGEPIIVGEELNKEALGDTQIRILPDPYKINININTVPSYHTHQHIGRVLRDEIKVPNFLHIDLESLDEQSDKRKNQGKI